jgi:hypothetical protein
MCFLNQGEKSYSLDGAATEKDRDINMMDPALSSLVTNLFNLILLEFLSFLLKKLFRFPFIY